MAFEEICHHLRFGQLGALTFLEPIFMSMVTLEKLGMSMEIEARRIADINIEEAECIRLSETLTETKGKHQVNGIKQECLVKNSLLLSAYRRESNRWRSRRDPIRQKMKCILWRGSSWTVKRN